MSAEERHHTILQLLDARERLTIGDLSTRLSVSDMTVRRDLAQLESEGLLRRVHGGAIRTRSGSFEPPFALRSRLNPEAKRTIAAQVANELTDGQTILLDGGTTGVAVAEAIVGRRLTVCCLNLRAAEILDGSPDMTIMVPGGRVRNDERSLVGPAAERTLADHRFDTMVMTASAVDAVAGITEWNVDDAAIKRAARASARRCILACDSSKFGQTAFARVGGLDAADLVVTDDDLAAEHRQAVQVAGTVLRLA